MSLSVCLQMEDGHTLFDYDVRLNDTIQLLVRQSLVLPASGGSKERDSELSDTDSGCGLGQSESDKSSNSGEVASEADGKAGLADDDTWDETELGLYKVRPRGRLGTGVLPGGTPHAPPSLWPGVPGPAVTISCGFLGWNTWSWVHDSFLILSQIRVLVAALCCGLCWVCKISKLAATSKIMKFHRKI